MSSILELVEYDENSITGLVAKQDFGRLGGKKFKGDDIGNQDVEGYYRFVYEGNSYKVHKVIYMNLLEERYQRVLLLTT